MPLNLELGGPVTGFETSESETTTLAINGGSPTTDGSVDYSTDSVIGIKSVRLIWAGTTSTSIPISISTTFDTPVDASSASALLFWLKPINDDSAVAFYRSWYRLTQMHWTIRVTDDAANYIERPAAEIPVKLKSGAWSPVYVSLSDFEEGQEDPTDMTSIETISISVELVNPDSESTIIHPYVQLLLDNLWTAT